MTRAELRHHLKPMAPVECYVPLSLRLKVGRHPRRVEPA